MIARCNDILLYSYPRIRYATRDTLRARYIATGGIEEIMVRILYWLAKIPRAVALAQAAAEGKSVAEYAPRSHAVPAFELLADDILAEKEKHND